MCEFLCGPVAAGFAADVAFPMDRIAIAASSAVTPSSNISFATNISFGISPAALRGALSAWEADLSGSSHHLHKRLSGLKDKIKQNQINIELMQVRSRPRADRSERHRGALRVE
jgi:hypothetical protein